MGLISRGWGLIKHLKFKTGGILLERGVQFNRKGGLVYRGLKIEGAAHQSVYDFFSFSGSLIIGSQTFAQR